ncbi:hypothetical protein K474DRAFT_1734137 [Panus rudis PR-1116 ss-1]|nr:hypothetical protein K474DRAFT_1734137 [Panus rudis PR-1116 ss-1]
MSAIESLKTKSARLLAELAIKQEQIQETMQALEALEALEEEARRAEEETKRKEAERIAKEEAKRKAQEELERKAREARKKAREATAGDTTSTGKWLPSRDNPCWACRMRNAKCVAAVTENGRQSSTCTACQSKKRRCHKDANPGPKRKRKPVTLDLTGLRDSPEGSDAPALKRPKAQRRLYIESEDEGEDQAGIGSGDEGQGQDIRDLLVAIAKQQAEMLQQQREVNRLLSRLV